MHFTATKTIPIIDFPKVPRQASRSLWSGMPRHLRTFSQARRVKSIEVVHGQDLEFRIWSLT